MGMSCPSCMPAGTRQCCRSVLLQKTRRAWFKRWAGSEPAPELLLCLSNRSVTDRWLRPALVCEPLVWLRFYASLPPGPALACEQAQPADTLTPALQATPALTALESSAWDIALSRVFDCVRRAVPWRMPCMRVHVGACGPYFVCKGSPWSWRRSSLVRARFTRTVLHLLRAHVCVRAP